MALNPGEAEGFTVEPPSTLSESENDDAKKGKGESNAEYYRFE